MAYDINIINRGSRTGSRSKTAATRSVQNLTRPKDTKIKNIARGMRAVRTGDIGGSLGIFGGLKGSIAFAAIQEGLKLVNKGVDIGLNYADAKTGESVNINNYRRAKNYALNPASYVVSATWGVRLTELQNKRKNAVNDYYQSLTGNMEHSVSYGEK